MKIKTLLTAIATFLLFYTTSAQEITGYWEGRIGVTKSDSLTIGIDVKNHGDSIVVELDSPDQFFVGQKTDDAVFDGVSLSFTVPSLGIRFSGDINADGSVITSVFTQHSKKFGLSLRKEAERKSFIRPQTPKGPFGYKTEELAFRDRKNRYTLISGTLTMPESPKALVVFISGSGWQDRDEFSFGHRPFAVIADACSRAGIATFRYDDLPHAIFIKSTTFDFADAVQLVLDSLNRIPELKHLKKGLLGHSEGSLVAFIAAAQNPDIDFTVHLGGVSLPIYDILTYQIRSLNSFDPSLTDEMLEKSVNISQELYKTVIKSKNTEDCKNALADKWDKITGKLTEDEKAKYKMTPDRYFQTIYSLSTPWYFTLFHIKPEEYIRKVSSPVLAISGGKDLQVPAVESQSKMRKHLKHNSSNKFVILDGLNHFLQPCTSGTVDEYAVIETTISEDVLEEIVRWIGDTVSEIP